MRMEPAQRGALLKELFATSGEGIRVSYLRLTIASSDMNARVYSYDDLPAGETDVDMAKFSLGPDEKDVVPIIKEILAINPAYPDTRLALVCSAMDENEWQAQGRESETRVLWGVCEVLCEIHRSNEGRRGHHQRDHGSERTPEPEKYAQHGDVRHRRGYIYREVSRALPFRRPESRPRYSSTTITPTFPHILYRSWQIPRPASMSMALPFTCTAATSPR